MLNYIIRRLAYFLPILVGINILTFALFFVVNTPDNMARVHLGQKYVNKAGIDNWKKQHGYDKPLFFNAQEKGIDKITKTIFYSKSLKLFFLDFGQSDMGRDISYDVKVRYKPSLMIAIPSLIFSMLVNMIFAFLIIFFRQSYLETVGIVSCIILLSISALFYIIFSQVLLAGWLKILPFSGYSMSLSGLKFLILPIIVSVIAGIGGGTRWYRILFLEEINKEYVRTARAKGLSELKVLYKHVLPNALIPILTSVVAMLPLLFLGSLLTESFFGIPGLGSYTIDAIQEQDFAIVRAMVFLGSLLYLIGLLLTDIAYTWADPRVRLTA